MGDRGQEARNEAQGRVPRSSITERDAMLVLLSLAAGCVDAVSYLGLNHVFTANMTGNTVLLGIALGQAQGQAGCGRASPWPGLSSVLPPERWSSSGGGKTLSGRP